MDYIIDIQGFRDDSGHLIPKEVAVVTLDRNCIAHWLIAPPYPFTELTSTSQRQNNWLSCKHHGIEWFEGEVPINFLHANLREIARTARLIYTRGHEEAALLQKITSRRITNLEDLNRASFKSLPVIDEFCFHHGVKKGITIYMCALNNVLRIKKWIEKERLDGVFSTSHNKTSTCSTPAIRSFTTVKEYLPGIAEDSGEDTVDSPQHM